MEPVEKASLFSPSTVVQGNDEMTFCLLNMSPKMRTLSRNAVVARATEVDAMMIRREEHEDGVQGDLYIVGEEESDKPDCLRVCRVTRMEGGISRVDFEPAEREMRRQVDPQQSRDSEGNLGGSVQDHATEFTEGTFDTVRKGQGEYLSNELDVSSSSVPNSATEYAGGMIGSVERDDSGSCQEANQGSRKLESRQLDSKGERSGGCPEHRNATGFADTPHMKSEEGYTTLPEYLRALYDETCKRLT